MPPTTEHAEVEKKDTGDSAVTGAALRAASTLLAEVYGAPGGGTPGGAGGSDAIRNGIRAAAMGIETAGGILPRVGIDFGGPPAAPAAEVPPADGERPRVPTEGRGSETPAPRPGAAPERPVTAPETPPAAGERPVRDPHYFFSSANAHDSFNRVVDGRIDLWKSPIVAGYSGGGFGIHTSPHGEDVPIGPGIRRAEIPEYKMVNGRVITNDPRRAVDDAMVRATDINFSREFGRNSRFTDSSDYNNTFDRERRLATSLPEHVRNNPDIRRILNSENPGREAFGALLTAQFRAPDGGHDSSAMLRRAFPETAALIKRTIEAGPTIPFNAR